MAKAAKAAPPTCRLRAQSWPKKWLRKKEKEKAGAKPKANPDQKPAKTGGRGTANYHVNEPIVGAFFASKAKKRNFRLADTDNNKQISRRLTMATHLKENRFYFTHDLGASKSFEGRDKALLQGTCPFVGRVVVRPCLT